MLYTPATLIIATASRRIYVQAFAPALVICCALNHFYFKELENRNYIYLIRVLADVKVGFLNTRLIFV